MLDRKKVVVLPSKWLNVQLFFFLEEEDDPDEE